jgi:hypothetical protein
MSEAKAMPYVDEFSLLFGLILFIRAASQLPSVAALVTAVLSALTESTSIILCFTLTSAYQPRLV